MKRKLFLLAAVLSLTLAVSASARPYPLYIICETCTTSDPWPCQCGSGTFHPGTVTDCSQWFGVCYG